MLKSIAKFTSVRYTHLVNLDTFGMYIDLINRIKNAQAARRRITRTPYTKMDAAITNILIRHGFVDKVAVIGRGAKKILKISLPAKRTVHAFQALSKPSLDRYAGARELKPVQGGRGLLVVSTPMGVLSGDEAKKQHVGGKLLFKVW